MSLAGAGTSPYFSNSVGAAEKSGLSAAGCSGGIGASGDGLGDGSPQGGSRVPHTSGCASAAPGALRRGGALAVLRHEAPALQGLPAGVPPGHAPTPPGSSLGLPTPLCRRLQPAPALLRAQGVNLATTVQAETGPGTEPVRQAGAGQLAAAPCLAPAPAHASGATCLCSARQRSRPTRSGLRLHPSCRLSHRHHRIPPVSPLGWEATLGKS